MNLQVALHLLRLGESLLEQEHEQADLLYFQSVPENRTLVDYVGVSGFFASAHKMLRLT